MNFTFKCGNILGQVIEVCLNLSFTRNILNSTDIGSSCSFELALSRIFPRQHKEALRNFLVIVFLKLFQDIMLTSVQHWGCVTERLVLIAATKCYFLEGGIMWCLAGKLD